MTRITLLKVEMFDPYIHFAEKKEFWNYSNALSFTNNTVTLNHYNDQKKGLEWKQNGASRSPRHTQHLRSMLRSIHMGTSQLDLAGWHVRDSRHEVLRWCHADPTGGGTPPSTWGALPTSHQRTRPTAKLSKRLPNGFKPTTSESALELETSKFTHSFLRRWTFLITPRTTELFKRKSEKGDFPPFCQHQTLLSLPTTRCSSEDAEPRGLLRPHTWPSVSL